MNDRPSPDHSRTDIFDPKAQMIVFGSGPASRDAAADGDALWRKVHAALAINNPGLRRKAIMGLSVNEQTAVAELFLALVPVAEAAASLVVALNGKAALSQIQKAALRETAEALTPFVDDETAEILRRTA